MNQDIMNNNDDDAVDKYDFKMVITYLARGIQRRLNSARGKVITFNPNRILKEEGMPNTAPAHRGLAIYILRILVKHGWATEKGRVGHEYKYIIYPDSPLWEFKGVNDNGEKLARWLTDIVNADENDSTHANTRAETH